MTRKSKNKKRLKRIVPLEEFGMVLLVLAESQRIRSDATRTDAVRKVIAREMVDGVAAKQTLAAIKERRRLNGQRSRTPAVEAGLDTRAKCNAEWDRHFKNNVPVRSIAAMIAATLGITPKQARAHTREKRKANLS